MKVLLLALFVAAAVAFPIPDEEATGPIDVIVNGVPEGHALDIGHLLDVKVQEHVDGTVVNTVDVLQPFTAEGIVAAAAQAAEEAAKPVDESTPEVETPSVQPSPALPDTSETELTPEVTLPQPIVLPEPATPEVILPEAQPVVDETAVDANPSPVAVVESAPEEPSPGVEGETPVAAEVVESLPAPAAQGDIYNDGIVQVSVNPTEPSLLANLSSWFNMMVNYVTNTGIQSSQVV